MALTYTMKEDGIMYPNLTLPKQENLPIGKYGQMRLDYMKKHRRGTLTTMVTEARLNLHLYEIDQAANKLISESISRQATSLGVTEQMKADDPMGWVAMMNNIKNSAEEEVLKTLIYV